MTPLDPNACALRRDPYTPQPVQIEPATGHLYGLVDGTLVLWRNGKYASLSPHDSPLDLVPLQIERQPLRCYAAVSTDAYGHEHVQAYWTQENCEAFMPTGAHFVPMVEAAELDRLRAAGNALAAKVDEALMILLQDDANAEASAMMLFGRSQWREAVK